MKLISYQINDNHTRLSAVVDGQVINLYDASIR